MNGNSKCVAALFVGLWLGPQHAFGQSLRATATVTVSNQNVWNYTLTNAEPSTSSNWLTDFYLPIFAPVTAITAPNNWYVDTDGVSYIEWSNVEDYPYPDDIAPGLSASGFSFTSVATSTPFQYGIGSWDHVNDAAGPDAIGNVLVPYAAPVPEASTILSLGLGLGSLGLLAFRRRARKS